MEHEVKPTIDPAMSTTMPVEDMIGHPDGPMYDFLMLKPKSWSIMGKTAFSKTYWQMWVDRSVYCIINSTMGKHGIGEPYAQMRNVKMMGTIVKRYRKSISISRLNTQCQLASWYEGLIGVVTTCRWGA